MMSIAQVRSAGSAGNYYTDKDNYYVLGSMGERWAGRGAEQLGLQAASIRMFLPVFWRGSCRTERI
ncbi:hypothetical protein JQK81_24695 [Escherichia coli]|nr:hypothetical protein [Escherichia coli]